MDSSTLEKFFSEANCPGIAALVRQAEKMKQENAELGPIGATLFNLNTIKFGHGNETVLEYLSLHAEKIIGCSEDTRKEYDELCRALATSIVRIEESLLETYRKNLAEYNITG